MLSDGVYAGYVQLVPLDNGSWEIGYHTVKAMTGRGYATEAVRAFLPVMMERLSLSEVDGICDANNIASRRVLEKCGFTYEGTLRREYSRFDGQVLDSCMYSITYDEWLGL